MADFHHIYLIYFLGDTAIKIQSVSVLELLSQTSVFYWFLLLIFSVSIAHARTGNYSPGRGITFQRLPFPNGLCDNIAMTTLDAALPE